jgi:demethylmenaquinone methyltransferase / 2-methoxy-6-polyprenyl-1,4-benzoquinol methylase
VVFERVDAVELFAPLGPTYDRYARLLSLGQDPRWRRFLVSRVQVGAADTVLDVATGTAAVAMELTRRTGCRVVGLDQSLEMLETGRRRVEAASLEGRIELVEGVAERLPFEDASFDALTFAGLIRYVDDPRVTMRELARVVRPGGGIAMFEFGLPRGLARGAWELYVRIGLPAFGALVSPGWRRAGSFFGPSIREFHQRYDLLELWRNAGIADVHSRRLSLGGGLVLWGHCG